VDVRCAVLIQPARIRTATRTSPCIPVSRRCSATRTSKPGTLRRFSPFFFSFFLFLFRFFFFFFFFFSSCCVLLRLHPLLTSSTLWYHDHALGVTRLNVEMGLAGFFLIHNPAHDALGLPSGEFDVPLMFLDRSFTREGDLFYSDPVPQHEFGRHMIVNGKAWPRMTVKRAAYRFRLLDASNHRHLDLSFVRTDTDETLSFQLIASDTGLIGAPRTLTNIPLVPSERWEIVLDFSDLSAGTEVLVKNSAAVMMMRMMGDMEMTPMMMAQMSAVDMPELMKFVVSSEQGPAAAVPSMLEPDYAARLPSASAVVGERHFVLRHGMDHAGDTMMTSGSMSGMSGGAMSAGGMSMTTTGGMGGMSSGMATGSGGMSSGMATGSGGMTSGMGGGGTMTMMMPMPNMSDPAEVRGSALIVCVCVCVCVYLLFLSYFSVVAHHFPRKTNRCSPPALASVCPRLTRAPFLPGSLRVPTMAGTCGTTSAIFRWPGPPSAG